MGGNDDTDSTRTSNPNTQAISGSQERKSGKLHTNDPHVYPDTITPMIFFEANSSHDVIPDGTEHNSKIG